jgi:hypothetical protein
MDNLIYVGPVVPYPDGLTAVEVVAPEWLLDDVQALPCVQTVQTAAVLINGEVQYGLRLWLSGDPVVALLQVETLLDLGAAWEDLLADVPILQGEA